MKIPFIHNPWFINYHPPSRSQTSLINNQKQININRKERVHMNGIWNSLLTFSFNTYQSTVLLLVIWIALRFKTLNWEGDAALGIRNLSPPTPPRWRLIIPWQILNLRSTKELVRRKLNKSIRIIKRILERKLGKMIWWVSNLSDFF